MSDSKLRLSKTPYTIPNFPEFTHITRFSNASSSFYQALSIGLLEILIRFRRLPNIESSLVTSLSDIITQVRSFCESKGLDIRFIKLFQHLIKLLSSDAKTIQVAFDWLKEYSENRDELVNESFDMAMRQILCSKFTQSNLQELILVDNRLDMSSALLQAFCNSMKICVSLHEEGRRVYYYNKAYSEYFLLPILKQKSEFSLLYTKGMNDSESTNEFNSDLLLGPEFMIKYSEIINSNERYFPESPKHRRYASISRVSNKERDSWKKKTTSPFKTSKNLLKLNPLIYSPSNNSSSSYRCNSRNIRPGTPGIRNKTAIIIEISCSKCKKNKPKTEYGSIKCHPVADCRVCFTCRKTNKEQCHNCDRYYSTNEICKLNSP